MKPIRNKLTQMPKKSSDSSPLPAASRASDCRSEDNESDDDSSKNTTGRDLPCSFISTAFTATRYSHIEKEQSPPNELRLRNTCRKATCVRSSASALSVDIRRQIDQITRLYDWKSAAQACSSPH